MSGSKRRRFARVAVAVVTVGVAAAAYTLVGGLPGLLYSAGFVLLGLFVAMRLRAGSGAGDDAEAAPPERPRRRRKSLVIADLRADLAAATAELESRALELSALRSLHESESEAARAAEERLTSRIRELEQALEQTYALVETERQRVERSLGALSGGIDQRSHELAALERDLEAIIAA